MLKTIAPSLVVALAVFTSSTSRAEQSDCPPGSVEKNEEGFTWCEPSVCLNDGQCNPGYVCVPMPLCMEIGNMTKPGATTDAGSRLIARQICAEGTCPQRQTCSAAQRCLPRATAERMNKLPNAAPSSSAPTAPDGAKKSSCGCRAVGSPTASTGGAFALAALAVVLGSRRRRR